MQKKPRAEFGIIYQRRDNDSLFLFAARSEQKHLFSLYRVDLMNHPQGEWINQRKVNDMVYHRQFLEEDPFLRKGDVQMFFSAQGTKGYRAIDIEQADIAMGSLSDTGGAALERVVLLLGAIYFYTKFEAQKKDSKEKKY